MASLCSSKLPDASVARLIDQAIAVVRSADETIQADSEIIQSFKALWEKRLWLCLQSGKMLLPDDGTLRACQSDRDRLKQAGVLDSDLLAVSDAWQCECCLAAKKADDRVRDFASKAGKAEDPSYVHYVRAIASRSVANPKWKNVVVSELANVFAPVLAAQKADPSVPAMQRTDRLTNAAELAVESDR